MLRHPHRLTPRRLEWAVIAAVMGVGALTACATAGSGAATDGAAAVAAAGHDSTSGNLVPAGYGTLRQDDLSLHIQGTGVLVRALPLDESLIRLLTPDSYHAMRELEVSNRRAIDTVGRRNGGRPVSVWLISFYGLLPDARFTPLDVLISSGGREFRPYDAIPLTASFGEQRLRQRETQSALFVYDGDIAVNQPITVTYEGVSDDSWEQMLQQIERERAMVRARATR